MTAPHRAEYRVYYEDTDAAGVVYYANYLKFAERARTEALRSGGVNQSLLWQDSQVGFVVRRCEIDYHLPARLDDLLCVESSLQELRAASMTMFQRILRGDALLASLTVDVACIGPKFTPVRIPREIAEALARQLQPLT